jgi:hypothetical protein
MIQRILAAFALALALAAPAAAQGDERLAREMRQVADATSGVTIGGGAAADKVVYFGRRGDGELIITGIAALAPGAPFEAIPDEAIAVLRTRASTTSRNAAPEPGDFALARESDRPVFIVGEWRTPPVLWEVSRRGDGVAWREIGADGRAGAWMQPPP